MAGRAKNNFMLFVIICAVAGFGALLVFHLHGFFAYRRDGRIAQENSEIAQEMFADIVELGMAGHPPLQGGLLAPARIMAGNEDVVAFISIPGTNIGNLVVQGHDNEFYLYHDAHGQPNVNGALFMDYRNRPDFFDPNTIIYGHNMRNGTMFHNLRYYMSRDFFEANPHIAIVTDQYVLIYEIFAAFSTNIDFYYIQVNFETPEQFEGLINEMINRSAYNTSITPTATDRILILSTCTNIREDTRFVVAARLVPAIYD
ncbi:MAG: class B sortase [Defluviitaleaceae bacterium]|nr:class B sortase [Defluviitaleaceae bacterium]